MMIAARDMVIAENIPPGVSISSLPFLLCETEHQTLKLIGYLSSELI